MPGPAAVLNILVNAHTGKAVAELQAVNAEAAASGTTMSKLGKAAKIGGLAAAAGIGIAVVASKSFIDAASEAQVSQKQMSAQLKASGVSYRAHAKEIDRVIQKTSQLSGLDDEDLQNSFTNIVRTTGSVTESLKLTGLAADFARAKHIEVAKAGEIVAKVAGGNTGILSRYGISIDKGATATEALGALQQKFAGQAAAYGKTTAGAQDRFAVATENLQEALGKKLLPVVASAANGLANFTNGMTNGTGAGGQFRDAITNLWQGVAPLAQGLGNVVGKVASLTAAFAQSKAGAALLAGGLGALAGAMIAGKVTAMVTAMEGLWTVLRALPGGIAAVKAAMTALNISMASSGIGAAVVVIGALVGALIGMGIQSRAAKVSSDELSTALDRQRDAAQALADSDLDLAQRRANAQSATVQLKQAEDGLKTARASGNHDQIRAAEASYAQAKVESSRASRELSRWEGDNSVKRRENTTQVQAAVRASQGRVNTLQSEIGKLRDHISATKDLIEWDKKNQPSRLARDEDDLANSVSRLNGKQRDLNHALNSMPKNVRAKVNVEGVITFGLSGTAKSAITNAINSATKPKKRASGGAIPGIPSRGDVVPALLTGGEVVLNERQQQMVGKGRIYDTLRATGAPTVGMASGGVVASAAKRAGFKGKGLVTAIAVADAESGFNEHAKNLKYPDHSIGLWQINQLAHKGRYGSDSALQNPYTNAKAAFAISSGGKNWGPWSTYTNHAYQRYLGVAKKLAGSSKATTKKSGSSKGGSGSKSTFAASAKRLGKSVGVGMGTGSAAGGDTGVADTSATDALNAQLATLADLYGQFVTNQNNILRLSNQGPEILASVVAAVSGQIGGQTGLGFQSVGVPGSVARY